MEPDQTIEPGQVAEPAEIYNSVKNHWLGYLLSSISLATVILGLVFGLIEYRSYQADQRIERTFRFLERFQQGEIATAQRTITNTLRQLDPAMRDLVTQNLPQEDLIAHVQGMRDFALYESNNGDGITREIDVVVLFLDQIGICVAEQLCDANVSRQLFGHYTETLVDNFDVYFDAQKEFAPYYGSNLEKLYLENVH